MLQRDDPAEEPASGDEDAEREEAELLSAPAAPPARRQVRPWLRLGGLALLVVAGWAFLFATGLIDQLEEEKVRALVSGAGAYGVVLFVAAFVGAQLLHLPGSVFIAAAAVAWGWDLGFAIAWVASVLAMTVNFTFVKSVGGDALLTVDRPLLHKILAHLHRRPMTTIFVSRAVFMTSPWLAATLALAGVRQRDHFIASALGIVPQILVWTVGVDWLV